MAPPTPMLTPALAAPTTSHPTAGSSALALPIRLPALLAVIPASVAPPATPASTTASPAAALRSTLRTTGLRAAVVGSAVLDATRSLSPERLGDLLTGWVATLPGPLARALPRDLVGYGLLGALTFALDMALLMVLHATTPLPLGVAVLCADGVAWAMNFWLNRTVNFRSRDRVGPQAARYGAVVCVDLAISTGVTTALAALGTPVLVARLAAGGAIALVGYLSCRFWVFRPRCRRLRTA